ncbi:hypothetical protein SAMN04488104_101851 [Algoriphagus faecimaris]|uniref:6-bladed beta-propeller protein n=1 Tax=Algoriphagus faecimaris TaxID=686796 RepID=A0A1G6SRC7_9BACT|nr:6-bladed beta-propeller [Algoriphagus faecimaris]SDD19432.1 hypothetical protein SAMN04488104_101851 [Algoriphagus faecimaris]
MMKKIGITQILLILGLLNFSCQNNNQKKPELTSIDLELVTGNLFSEVFEEINYVLLKENDTLPLVQPLKTVVTDDFIYILDIKLNNLFKFNRNGEIIHIFNSSGQGPQEFIQIQDYQVKQDTVILQDNLSNKLIYFDDDGKFLKETKLPSSSANFFKGANFTLHFTDGMEGIGKDFLKISDSNQLNFLDIGLSPPKGRVRLIHGFAEDEKTEIRTLTLPFSHQVVVFDPLGNILQLKEFEFLNPPELTEEEKKYLQVKIINAFLPFPDFNYMSVFFGRNSFQFILDKKFNLLFSGKNIQNDIDGMNYRILPISHHQEQLILYHPSTRIYNLYQSASIPEQNDHFKSNIHDFYNTNHEAPKGDRHVLVFLDLKPVIPN